MFDQVPVWTLAVGTIVLVLVAHAIGKAIGHASRSHPKEEKESSSGAISGAILGLLAFMLAFTFGMASDRFDQRKAIVREEAAAIERTYLQADFLSDSARTVSRHLLRQYVDHRIASDRLTNPAGLAQHHADAKRIHGELWSIVAAESRHGLDTELGALYASSLGQVIDLHTRRTAVALYARIPSGVWEVLFALIGTSLLAVGYHSAIAGSRRSWSAIVLAFSLALVIALIGVLDRPQTGLLRVSQQALIDVRSSIDAYPRSR